MVDELYLVVEPVLFGAGLPLLRVVDAEYKMTLLDVQKLNTHTVQLHYRLIQSMNHWPPQAMNRAKQLALYLLRVTRSSCSPT